MALNDTTNPTPAVTIRMHQWPARTGWSWLGRGLNLYMRQPLGLISMVALGPLLSLTLLMLPVLGQLLAMTLFPILLAGMLHCAHRAHWGLPPRMAVYLDTIKDPVRRWRLFQLGVLYAMVVGLLGVVWAVMVGTPAPVAATPPATGAGPETVSVAELLASLGLVLATIPVQVTILLATALISFYGMATPKAVFSALMAAWRNKGAIALNLVGLSGLTVLSLMSLGALVDMFSLSADTVQKLVVPFVLALMPIGIASSFVMIGDIFAAEVDPAGRDAPSTATPL
jgi:hypothetical protein